MVKKIKDKLTLISNCSEYVEHISLTVDEVRLANKILDELDIMNNDDRDHLLSHFGYSKTPLNRGVTISYGEGISFIERDIVDFYEYIRDLIKSVRNNERTNDEIISKVIKEKDKISKYLCKMNEG